MNIGTASWLEILWTVLCLVGAAFAWWLYRQATVDEEALEFVYRVRPSMVRDVRRKRIVARGNRRAQFVRLCVILLFVMSGGAAMLTEPAAGSSNAEPSLLSWVLALGFIVAVLMLDVDGFLQWRERSEYLQVAPAREALKQNGNDKDKDKARNGNGHNQSSKGDR